MKLVNRTAPHLNGKAPLPNGSNGAPKAPAGDRDQKSGRFAPGNTASVGHVNPTARARAALHKALVAAVTAEDIDRLAKALLQNAVGGDVASAELLLRYAVGKPIPATDPDRVALEAWQLVQAWPMLVEFVTASARAVDPEFAAALGRVGAIADPDKLAARLDDADEEDMDPQVGRIITRRLKTGK